MKRRWISYLYIAGIAVILALSGTLLMKSVLERKEPKKSESPGNTYNLDEYFAAASETSEEVQAVDEKNVKLAEPALPEIEEEAADAAYILKCVDGQVVVYKSDNLTDAFMDTGITVEELPEDTVLELQAGKEIRDEAALYSFLETHSS